MKLLVLVSVSNLPTPRGHIKIVDAFDHHAGGSGFQQQRHQRDGVLRNHDHHGGRRPTESTQPSQEQETFSHLFPGHHDDPCYPRGPKLLIEFSCCRHRTAPKIETGGRTGRAVSECRRPEELVRPRKLSLNGRRPPGLSFQKQKVCLVPLRNGRSENLVEIEVDRMYSLALAGSLKTGTIRSIEHGPF